MTKTKGIRLYRYKKLGQSVTEYAVLLAVVASALIAMQIYLKRGIQGRIRDLSNQISPTQYERGTTTANYTVTQESETATTYNNQRSTVIISEQNPERTERWGGETVEPEVREASK